MDKLIYKTFVWPLNPHSYKEEAVREGVYEKNEDGQDVFQGMGLLKRIITGSGILQGETALEDYKALEALFTLTDPGNLIHPMFGIRYCYFTGLEMTQEPKEDYISYRFEFREAMTNGYLPK